MIFTCDGEKYPTGDFAEKYIEYAGADRIEQFGHRHWEFANIMRFGEFESDHVVLDIGGAHSFFMPYLSKFVQQTYIIDNGSFPKHEDWYRSLFGLPEFVSGKVVAIRQNARELPFRDTFFDRVISVSALEHFERQDETMCCSEIRRVLKPEGYFLGTVDFNPETEDPYTAIYGYRPPGHRTYTLVSFFERVVRAGDFSLVGGIGDIPGHINLPNVALFFLLRPGRRPDLCHTVFDRDNPGEVAETT